MKFVVQDFKAKAVDDSPRLTFFGANSPERIYEFYKNVVEADHGYEVEKEHVVVICLNTRLNVTGWHMVSIGSLSECTCHPREIFRPVIVRCAHAFVLCHNHPSGVMPHPDLCRMDVNSPSFSRGKRISDTA